MAHVLSGFTCPAGVRKCALLDEIIRLREECHQLEMLSQVDALTGLYNYRYLMKALAMEMERTRRSRLPTGLIMLDLDHFKRVNDTYGHQVGNLVLCWAAKIWKDNVRLIDIPCRYGGEEFSLLLPGTSLGQSVEIAERLRRALRAFPMELEHVQIPVRASFGVAVYRHTDRFTVDEFIAKADDYLLRAKHAGRDRIYAQEEEQLAAEGVSPEEKSRLFEKNQG